MIQPDREARQGDERDGGARIDILDISADSRDRFTELTGVNVVAHVIENVECLFAVAGNDQITTACGLDRLETGADAASAFLLGGDANGLAVGTGGGNNRLEAAPDNRSTAMVLNGSETFTLKTTSTGLARASITVDGGSGNDTPEGGEGGHVLTGSQDHDRFVLAADILVLDDGTRSHSTPPSPSATTRSPTSSGRGGTRST